MRQEDTNVLTGSKATVLDVGVDWLTATTKKDSVEHEFVLANWYDIFRLHRQKHGIYQEASFLGYQGVSCESMFVGTRYDGAMVRLSGKAARELWPQLWLSNCSITRLDVQVTVGWEGRGFHPARLAAMHAESANSQLPPNRQRNIEEHKDNKGGFTCYIGSRQSQSFSRCYNKSAQDPDSYGEGAWRYEVQYNSDMAPKVYEALVKHSDDLESACVALVWDWYERRGVIPVFRRSATMVPVSRETLSLTTLDRKLAWLYNQVRPTVADLIANGFQRETLVALLGVDLGGEVAKAVIVEAENLMSQGQGRGENVPYGEPDTP